MIFNNLSVIVNAVNSRMSLFYIIDTGPPSEVLLSSGYKYFTFFKVTHILKVRALITLKVYCISWVKKTRIQLSKLHFQYLNIIDILLWRLSMQTSKKILKHYLIINLNGWRILVCKISGSLFEKTHLNFFSMSKITSFSQLSVNMIYIISSNIFSLNYKTLLVLLPGKLI